MSPRLFTPYRPLILDPPPRGRRTPLPARLAVAWGLACGMMLLGFAGCSGPGGDGGARGVGEAPEVSARAIPDAVALAGIELRHPGGGAVALASLLGERPTVFLFTRTDCPISNRYAPEVERLAESHAGARFFRVYPDPAATAEEIARHGEDFAYTVPALTDPRHDLVAATGARVTPEAAVFDASGRLVYRGRIDDRWAAFGQLRAEPEHRDLAEVLSALAAGETLDPRSTPAVGCYIADLS